MLSTDRPTLSISIIGCVMMLTLKIVSGNLVSCSFGDVERFVFINTK